MSGSGWKGSGKWNPWYIAAWVSWVLAFVVLEGIALFDANDATPTLTETLTRWIPGFVVFCGIGWLIWHFIASYHEHDLLGKDDEDEEVG